jgi:superfamily II DNA or RNA helicase
MSDDLLDNEGLKGITLRQDYNTDENDIIRELYAPCLKIAIKYDRAVGFFRANIYRELGEELLDFIIRGGKVRIVCSPDIPESDEQAAREGYVLRDTRSETEQDSDLVHIMEKMSKDPGESDCLDMLRLLIEKGSLDLFIATRPGGIFHRKIGMFIDSYDNFVIFSGSGNETQRAISAIEDWSNDEDFDVYRCWGDDFERGKAIRKAQYLDKLFSGGTKHTKVRPINQVEREILNRFRTHSDFEDCRIGARSRSVAIPDESEPEPYYYQRLAIAAWEAAGRIGILSMATGTGKTITAIFAIKPLMVEGHPILILVPSRILFDQWLENIKRYFPNIPILLVGAGHDWKSDQTKRMFVSNICLPRIILSTMHTAASDDFMEFIGQSKNLVLVADEVHRLGSTKHRQVLEIAFKALLGLSATPERLYDREGSQALTIAFGEKPVYNLDMGDSVRIKEDDATEATILGHFLCNYSYDFDIAYLTSDEQVEWLRVTNDIRKEAARSNSNGRVGPQDEMPEKLKMMLIRRARIIKTALNKLDVTSRLIKERYPEGGRWIVYCEDENQLDQITERLRTENPRIVVLKYHSKMPMAERARTLSAFEADPGIIVSIRCLDEGVDIPSADGAIILASSTNPREYVQRRGRLLRKAKGKRVAGIIDVMALPTSIEGEDKVPFSMIRGELARAYIFAQHAINPEVTHRLWRICMQYGVNLDVDKEMSLQEDDWEE